jgi:hypothetical protein
VNFPFTWKNFPGPLVLKYPHLFTFMLSWITTFHFS